MQFKTLINYLTIVNYMLFYLPEGALYELAGSQPGFSVWSRRNNWHLLNITFSGENIHILSQCNVYYLYTDHFDVSYWITNQFYTVFINCIIKE